MVVAHRRARVRASGGRAYVVAADIGVRAVRSDFNRRGAVSFRAARNQSVSRRVYENSYGRARRRSGRGVRRQRVHAVHGVRILSPQNAVAASGRGLSRGKGDRGCRVFFERLQRACAKAAARRKRVRDKSVRVRRHGAAHRRRVRQAGISRRIRRTRSRWSTAGLCRTCLLRASRFCRRARRA